jgi:P2 family phage contractile tail tube protein
MLAQKLRNLNLFVDGYGMAGKVTEVSLPKIAAKTEEHRAGGMDAPVKYDMGLEALVASFTLAEYNAGVLTRFGLVDGNSTSLTIRGHAEDERGNSQTIVAQMVGRLEAQDPGSWKAGDNAELKGELSCQFYSLKINGVEIYRIDIPNMVRMIGGVDQLKKQRESLGIGGPIVYVDVAVNLP